MGVLKVLGLQLCLLALSLGAEARFEWSASDTKDTDEEPNSMHQPIHFETGYEALHQAEAPEFGLEVKHQDPQDFDIMLMTHRVRRSEEKKKKKKRVKTRVGAYAPLGQPAPEMIRTKRELQEGKTLPGRRPGKYSPLGRESPPTQVPKKSLD